MASLFHVYAASNGTASSSVVDNASARDYCNALRKSPEWQGSYRVYNRDGMPFGARHRFTHACGDVVTIRIALPQ